MERNYSERFRQILRRVKSDENRELYESISAKFSGERDRRVWEIFQEFQTEDVRRWKGDIDKYKVMGTAAGVLMAKLMNKLMGGNAINPLIGSAGVSAVPMAARVSQMVGQKENPSNFLLMHAMGPNVAGVIGSAIAAGILLSYIG